MNTPKWNIQLLAERNVYEPSEDTFLLLDALELDLENIVNSKPGIVLEIGSGSGVVISAIASVTNGKSHCIAVDVNPNACFVSKNTAELNNVNVDIINGNLLNALKLRSGIDMIVFNPPYVETDDEDTLETGITQSWAGGVKGRKIIDELLPVLNEALSLNGSFYMVAISYNDIENLKKCMKKYGFSCTVLLERQIRGELLYVLKYLKVIELPV